MDYGRQIFNAEIAPRLQKHHEGCVVLIDLDSGAWEVSQNYRDGLDKVTNRNPSARVWYKTIPVVPDELDQAQQSLVRRIGGRPDLAFQALHRSVHDSTELAIGANHGRRKKR